ncbi:fimbria/pilus outer membrane usher protein [Pseudomonas sp. OTU5201]|uniref:fimbria/pilus outer membrane usher protein n=1 Tax=Pseudomonas sp. OTU5201 TaxID=3043850 RepID=UPI00313C9B1B
MDEHRSPGFALAPLSAAVLGGLALMPGAAVATEQGKATDKVIFNDIFLAPDERIVDLSLFNEENPLVPGDYRADIRLNGKLTLRRDVRVARDAAGEPLVCVDREMLEQVGVDLDGLDSAARLLLDQTAPCADLAALIENASATFDMGALRLDLSVPQASLRRNARGYVSPELWDSGVTAGILGYNLNATRSENRSGNTDSLYTGLDSGINLGDWRVRHNGSLTWQDGSGQDYQALNTYVQRDITALKSQLTLGETSSSGELFDSVPFTGVQLASDDRMKPHSQRGYAPVIQGIARTNARVQVRQFGNLVLETTVAPGAFVIDDLNAMGYGGDLEVTVLEADGSEQRFFVPYASVAQLLRPGARRYNLSAGRLRNESLKDEPYFAQGTLQQGLSNLVTAYGGAQASEDFMALMAGSAYSTAVGALAIDLTQAQARLASGDRNGRSLRMTYNKNLAQSGTNIAIAAYRFSTENYMDLATAARIRDDEQRGYAARALGRTRSRLSATVSQDLGDWGRVTFNGIAQNYWNLPGNDLQYQFSYARQIRGIGLSVTGTRTTSRDSGTDNNLLLSLSAPLDFGGRASRQYVSASYSRGSDGRHNERASLSGIAGEDSQYTYSVSGSRDSSTRSVSPSVSGRYAAPYASASGSLSRGKGYKSASLGLSGSIVAHPRGITLSPQNGDTIAVVVAPGASGARLTGRSNLRLDRSGQAVLPFLQPYEMNEVGIDPRGSSLDVELAETSRQVAPRAGAVVLLEYETSRGRAVLLRATLADGTPVPFGANVQDDYGQNIGMVGQDGQLYARVAEGTGYAQVRWGQGSEQQCRVTLPEAANDLDMQEVLCAR